MQPIPAYIGLIFCILTVFVFATAPWWDRREKPISIVVAFVAVRLNPLPQYSFPLDMRNLICEPASLWYSLLFGSS
jgi:hypothetical protein